MPISSSVVAPWAHVCEIILFAVLAFGAYVGVRLVDRATATLDHAAALLDSGVASQR